VSRENYRASDVALANQAVLDLGELGYGGLNDCAYKAVLLVEGVSEVKLFQELHNKFGARNEVVIVPLGGDSLASGKSDCELAELRRLSDTTFAVVDSERQGKGAPAAKRRRDFQASCEALGIDCLVWSAGQSRTTLTKTSPAAYFVSRRPAFWGVRQAWA
jgi:hypothetical protein